MVAFPVLRRRYGLIRGDCGDLEEKLLLGHYIRPTGEPNGRLDLRCRGGAVCPPRPSQPESERELYELQERINARLLETALQEVRVRERLARVRQRVLAVDWREDKPNDNGPPTRLADVAVYDYDNDVLVVAAVDLREGTVTELVEREGAAPPISEEELAEAREIAGQAGSWPEDDATTVAFPVPRYAFESKPERQRHRGCTLYRDSGGERDLSITVDLSAREVVPDHELPDVLRSGGGTAAS
jgi:hypothetical protein